MSNSKPKLFFNTGDEDKIAVEEILKADIECELSGPISEEQTPLLVHNSTRFYGLEGVREFIERNK